MPNLVEIYSVVPEKNLKMFKSLRTTHDKQKAIFHVNDSGDLKTCTAVSYKKSEIECRDLRYRKIYE